MKIAVFLPNWIGDVVMATPALRSLRKKYPHAEITGVMRPYVKDVIAGLDTIDKVIAHSPKGKNFRQKGIPIIWKLRKEKFDLAILFPNSMRSGFLGWCSGAKRRVGFARDGRNFLLTDSLISFSKSTPNPVIDEYNRIALQLNCTKISRKTELAVLPEDREQLKNFWKTQSHHLQDKPYVCINPGGAFGAAKHWSSEKFGRLASLIATECNRTVLVVCGPSEREEAKAICKQANHPNVISMAEFPLSIGLTKAAVQSSELLVSTDSGPRHFAQPFQVPVITIFGPTHIAWSETYYDKAIHIQHEVDCGPCQERVCPLKHHRCMQDLSVQRVFQNVISVLNPTSKKEIAS